MEHETEPIDGNGGYRFFRLKKVIRALRDATRTKTGKRAIKLMRRIRDRESTRLPGAATPPPSTNSVGVGSDPGLRLAQSRGSGRLSGLHLVGLDLYPDAPLNHMTEGHQTRIDFCSVGRCLTLAVSSR